MLIAIRISSSNMVDDEFDRYCNWSRNPNDFINNYCTSAKYEMGSYEILDSPDTEIANHVSEESAKSIFLDEKNDNENNVLLYRVRSFRRTHKGVINEGDRVKACSTMSLNLPARSKSFTNESKSTFLKTENVSLSSPEENIKIPLREIKEDKYFLESEISNTFLIMVCGTKGVGKTSLCEQFMSSDSAYLNDDDNEEFDTFLKKVTVDLDDKEWNLIFRDTEEISIAEIARISPDALVIVYSVENKESFDWCSNLLQANFDVLTTSALFVVATKSDLERLRQISSEKGKRLADIYDGEFAEVSSILNHMVDHLLVQLILKIRSHKRKLVKKNNSISKQTLKHKKSSPADFFVNMFRKLSRAM